MTSIRNPNLVTYILMPLLWIVASASCANPVNQFIPNAAQYYSVPVDALKAIALTESGRTIKQHYQPWPWTLNIEGKAYRFSSRTATWKALRLALAAGRESVDIGPMQINWKAHSRLLKSPWQALDVQFNIYVGAYILATQYKRSKNWWTAIGHYHSRTPRLARAYRKRVAKQLVKLKRLRA